jgi:ubiquinone/menaquinone biosynthesis C-methylase UbiE
VVSQIYRLISGGTDVHWLPWFLNNYLPPGTRFSRSLSVCCGDGAHEIALYNTGKVDFVHGFDISEGAIRQAVGSFEKAGAAKSRYRFEVADADDLRIDGPFDLILSTGALHHVANLEHLLGRLSRMLLPNGYFVVLEYTGPNRFQWRDEQLGVINAILQQLDVRYLKNNQRVELSRPPMAEFLAIDPSEAVRSEDVLRVLAEKFTIEYKRNFNGTIMHPLYPLLNSDLTNAGAQDFDSIVRLILLLENCLISNHALQSDFVFLVCRTKT